MGSSAESASRANIAESEREKPVGTCSGRCSPSAWRNSPNKSCNCLVSIPLFYHETVAQSNHIVVYYNHVVVICNYVIEAIVYGGSSCHRLERSNAMHRHAVGEHSSQRYLSHFNSLFTGPGSRVYDLGMVRLTRRLYQRVIADLAALRLAQGQALSARTAPGSLFRQPACWLPWRQRAAVYPFVDIIVL